MAFGLTPWDPFRDFDRLDRLMRRGFEAPFGRTAEVIGAPAVEITDESDHYLVKAEIPGVPEDAVEITLNGNVLTLRGEKRYEHTEPAGGGQQQAAAGAQQGQQPAQGKMQEQKAGQEQKQGQEQQKQAAGKAPGTEMAKAEGKGAGGRAIAQRETGGELARPIFSEVYYGRFERMLTLPDDIDPERVNATANNGVFRIEIGKKSQQRAKRISVTRH